jgi:hypothetical protein
MSPFRAAHQSYSHQPYTAAARHALFVRFHRGNVHNMNSLHSRRLRCVALLGLGWVGLCALLPPWLAGRLASDYLWASGCLVDPHSWPPTDTHAVIVILIMSESEAKTFLLLFEGPAPNKMVDPCMSCFISMVKAFLPSKDDGHRQNS